MIRNGTRSLASTLLALAFVAAPRGPAAAGSPPDESATRARDDGYRGLWYANQPTGDYYRYKYSGGFATYPQQHTPIAVYSREADKTFFCYGGRPRDANRLLGQLSRAYEDGDLQGMRALFAEDAQGPTGGLNSILAEYRRVFDDSSERSLAMRDVSWFVSGDTFTIVATFEANVTGGRAGRSRKTRGDLRLDLRREGDHWQIYRMQHGERPG